MSDATISLLVLGAAMALFVSNRFAPEVVAFGAAVALAAFGVLTPEEVVAGFGEPTVILIAALLVVSEGLEAAGLTAWAGHQLVSRAGSRRTLIALLLALSALLAAIITPNGAIAALVPVAVVLAMRSSTPPSFVLMPTAFAATAGGLLALTGTPVNVIVSEAAADVDGKGFRFLEFALVGLPLTLATLAFCLLLGDRLIPRRSARKMPPDLSEHARTLARQYAIRPEVMDHHAVPDPLLTRTSGAAEVVIPPRSALIGETFFPGMVTADADLVVLAIQRGGEDVEEPTELAAGDTLLLHGEWSALETGPGGVLFVEDPAAVRRQAVPLGEGALRMVVILVALVILLATGAIPAFMAAFLAAGAIVLSGVLPVEQIYHSIAWGTVVLIGAMLAVGLAITSSGAADDLAGVLVDVVGDSSPHVLLLGLFVLTLVLGQLISNTATALIVVPVAVSCAAEVGVSVRPVLMCVAVASCTSFLTPLATTPNLIVMGAGGYRFGDYWRLGVCLTVMFGLVAVMLVPVFWGF